MTAKFGLGVWTGRPGEEAQRVGQEADHLNIPPFQKRRGCATRKGSRVRLCRNHKRTAEYSAGHWAAQNC
jgi:hypothetical protein